MPDQNNHSRSISIDLKAFVLRVINTIYVRVFREEMTNDIKTFLKNFIYIGVGMALSTIFSTIFSIFGGRILGPEEYGKYALIQSAATFLCLPMLLGFNNAMLKYVSEKPDAQRQSDIICTTNILVLIFTSCSVAVFIILGSRLSNLFHISQNLFLLSVVSAVIFVFYIITTNLLRGLEKNHAYAVFQATYGFMLLLFFFLFILVFDKSKSFIAMAYPMLLAYGISALFIVVFFMRKYMKWKFNYYWAKILTSYAFFALIGTLPLITYLNLARILISKYMTIADVGIFSAYYAASFGVISFFWGIFTIVYFPTISKYKEKSIIFGRINKLIPYLFGLGIPFIYVLEFLVLKTYGNHYPIDFVTMLLFSVSSVLMVCYGLFDLTFASEGIRGMKLDNIGNIATGITNIGLSLYFIPRLGLNGAAIALILSFSVGVICLYYLRKRIA
jgi:O-antigen/teichoic acid export membrane protein